jgi:hypothetical protein
MHQALPLIGALACIVVTVGALWLIIERIRLYSTGARAALRHDAELIKLKAELGGLKARVISLENRVEIVSQDLRKVVSFLRKKGSP